MQNGRLVPLRGKRKSARKSAFFVVPRTGLEPVQPLRVTGF